MRYAYTVAEDGGACIVNCPDDPVRLDVPAALGGHALRRIGPHAFCTCYRLESVRLPDGLEAIGAYAFMNTALHALETPPSLRRIEKNAFYKCARLERATLNDGLRSIGESAFRESALVALEVPASVCELGQNVFKDTALVVSGPGQTLHIARANESFRLHGGALYACGSDQVVLVQVLDEELVEYAGEVPIAAVAQRAFANLVHLRRVVPPDGVKTIGNETFKGCVELEEVVLPDSVETIGARAFMSTRLASLRIPAAIWQVGTAAFYTGTTIARNFKRTIQRVEIAPRNAAFYLIDDMLCQRRPGMGDIVLLYLGDGGTLYLQSFGCLKGHVQARGALHELAAHYPDMPITVLDYDPESSALNRENRIRLAVSAALGRRQ